MEMLADLTDEKKKALKKLQYIRKGWLKAWLDDETETLYLTAEDYRAAKERSRRCPPRSRSRKRWKPAMLRSILRPPAALPPCWKRSSSSCRMHRRGKSWRRCTRPPPPSATGWKRTRKACPKPGRFAEYYIPTTLKLLHTYNDVQGQQGENAETIRRDIAGILHTLNQAYDNLYDNLLSDVAMDVSSEIAALQGMLANDGLTGEGIAMTYRAWNIKPLDRTALKELTAAIAAAEHRRAGRAAPWTRSAVERGKISDCAGGPAEGSGPAGGHPGRPRHHRPRRGADPAGGRGRADRPHAPDRYGQRLCSASCRPSTTGRPSLSSAITMWTA